MCVGSGLKDLHISTLGDTAQESAEEANRRCWRDTCTRKVLSMDAVRNGFAGSAQCGVKSRRYVWEGSAQRGSLGEKSLACTLAK